MGFAEKMPGHLQRECPHVNLAEIEWKSDANASAIPYGLLIRTFELGRDAAYQSPLDDEWEPSPMPVPHRASPRDAEETVEQPVPGDGAAKQAKRQRDGNDVNDVVGEALRQLASADVTPDLLAAAMRSHPAAEQVQSYCADAVGRLAKSEVHHASIVSAGCVDLLAAAMRSHPAAEQVQRSCSFALRALDK